MLGCQRITICRAWKCRRQSSITSANTGHEIAFAEAAYSLGLLPGHEYATTRLRFVYSSPATPQQTWDYDLESLRKNIGVIFQDFVRYDFVLRENIGVSQVEALSDDARIRGAATRSLADTLAARFERGYDQMLGRRFDGGVELSGGEWQKVALARAYMREAQVLILDEPTAALDARAEYQVFLRFAELTRGKMAVLISHRFSTVRMADRILVLQGGELVEQGTHEELVERQGLYAELFGLQACELTQRPDAGRRLLRRDQCLGHRERIKRAEKQRQRGSIVAVRSQ